MKIRLFLILSLFFLLTTVSVNAREPWRNDTSNLPSPTGTIGLPKYSNANANTNTWSSTGQVNGFNPSFLQQQLTYSINAGTIITGIMATPISSKLSQPGTIIAIDLPLGYKSNNTTLIPPGSKIIGVVMNTSPSATLNHGHPGRIELSLQTLVFPSGKSTEFHGFISHNVSQDQIKEALTKSAGFDVKDYPQLGTSFLRSFTLGIGAFTKKNNQGGDLNIAAGTMIPIKLTRRLDLAQMINFQYSPNNNSLPANYSQWGNTVKTNSNPYNAYSSINNPNNNSAPNQSQLNPNINSYNPNSNLTQNQSQFNSSLNPYNANSNGSALNFPNTNNQVNSNTNNTAFTQNQNLPHNLAPLPPNNIDNLINPNSNANLYKQQLDKNPNSVFDIPVDGYPTANTHKISP